MPLVRLLNNYESFIDESLLLKITEDWNENDTSIEELAKKYHRSAEQLTIELLHQGLEGKLTRPIGYRFKS